MPSWTKGPTLAIGGVVALAFVNETTIAVGSHSGLGIIDVLTGVVHERIPDIAGDYSWYESDPPAVRHRTPRGVVLLPAAGLWGGVLPTESGDGWTTRLVSEGALLQHADHPPVLITDDDDPRTVGFSPKASVWVFATSPTVYIYLRHAALAPGPLSW